MLVVIGGMSVSAKQLTYAQQTHIYEEPTDQYLQADTGVAEQLFADWTVEQKRLLEQKQRRERRVPTNVLVVKDKVDGYTQGQLKNCWEFVQNYILKGYGAAKNHPINHDDPRVGSIMVSYESPKGHYSKVIVVFEKDFIVAEFNYVSGYYTERVIPKNSPIIKGFWN